MAVVAGGAITGIGMFNALVMSYTRLPMAMAEDGMLPRVLARRNSRGVPWVSVLLCGLAWALALKLPFERLISIDLILYGSSLLLEFVALVVLRIREPQSCPALQSRQPGLRLPARQSVPRRSSATPSMPRATKSSSAQPRRCSSRSESPCSGPCSTGSPPLPWRAAASPRAAAD